MPGQVFRVLSRYTGLFLLGIVILFAGQAAAQTATFSMLVSTGAPITVTGGQSQTASGTVFLLGHDFGCAADTPFPVTVTATATGGLTAIVATPELAFASGTGLYPSDPSGMGAVPLPPYNVSQPISVTISAPAGLTSDATAQVTIAGSFPGGDFGPVAGGGCGPGPFPATEGSGTIQVNVRADVTAPPGGADDGGDDGTPPPGDGTGDGTDQEEDGSPMGTYVVPLALLGAALIAARRRKQ